MGAFVVALCGCTSPGLDFLLRANVLDHCFSSSHRQVNYENGHIARFRSSAITLSSLHMKVEIWLMGFYYGKH